MTDKTRNHGLALVGCGLVLAAMLVLNLVGPRDDAVVSHGWPLSYLLRLDLTSDTFDGVNRCVWGNGLRSDFRLSFLLVNGLAGVLLLVGVYYALRRAAHPRFSIATLLSVLAAVAVWLRSSVRHHREVPYDALDWMRFVSLLIVFIALIAACYGCTVLLMKRLRLERLADIPVPDNGYYWGLAMSIATAIVMLAGNSVGPEFGWPFQFLARRNASPSSGWLWSESDWVPTNWSAFHADAFVMFFMVFGVYWRFRLVPVPKTAAPVSVALLMAFAIWYGIGKFRQEWNVRALTSPPFIAMNVAVFVCLVLAIQGYFKLMGDILAWPPKPPPRFRENYVL